MPLPPYRIGRTLQAQEQLRQIVAQAISAGKADVVRAAAEELIKQLQSAAASVGEPLRRTHKQGGVVRHLVVGPLSTHYAVYEAERVVLLLEFMLLSLPD